MPRKLPNIIITGTPTVGKTTTCTQLISLASDLAPSSQNPGSSPPPLRLRHLSINDLVRQKGCHEGWDEEMRSWIVDEDAVVDEVEKVLGVGRIGGEDGGGDEEKEEEEGGWLIDWHACDVFPKSWLDLVVVLRCTRTEVLWDRLRARDYPEAKLQENLDAEIFGVLLEEAKEAFDEEMVVELKSETAEDVEENCERILQWIQTWRENQRKNGGDTEGSE
ncbi:hypothetical protein EPUS_04032 [Endocarpon pusillum Z07020]|uniref:Adenylate kinase isoenzyme 6 homolog n=1 Tax=Endocarpon pusillum (strain Z07020 / HMAS-L-300199) TaxID=1263415 RepID=U1FWT8_ENDPU|nr:uncharacterized protein EPUS_04032 [Endocarpon pusillum Z07020]ERF69327.1 hypothetical protein EPUS_04032 [Endocarpon pusillum Z07020]